MKEGTSGLVLSATSVLSGIGGTILGSKAADARLLWIYSTACD